MGKIMVLVGSSGSGKTTVAELLLRTTNCVKVTTCTTRSPRPGEVNGVHYHFLTNEQFTEGVKNGDFVETFRYAGHQYGTRYSELNELMKNNLNVVMVMEINGAKAIKEHYPENTCIVYLDRSFKDLVLAIMERDISNEDKADRIVQIPADMEVMNMTCVDHVVKNDTDKLKDTVMAVEKILLL